MAGKNSEYVIRRTWGAQLCRLWPWGVVLLLLAVLALGVQGLRQAKELNAARTAAAAEPPAPGAGTAEASPPPDSGKAVNGGRQALHEFLESLHQAAGLVAGETGEAAEYRLPSNSIPYALHSARLMAMIFVLAALVVIVWPQLVKPCVRARVWWWKHCARKHLVFGLVPTGFWPLKLVYREYSVICGLGWTGNEIARAIRSRPRMNRRLIVIEKDPENPFRAGLVALGDVIVLSGDAAREDVLRSAAVERATRVFITSDSDEMNCRVAAQLAGVLGKMQRPTCLPAERKDWGPKPGCHKECPVHYRTVMGYAQIVDEQLRSHVENTTRNSHLDVRCFDTYALAAKHLLTRHSPFAGDETERDVHIMVAGGTAIGDAVLLESMYQAHAQKGRKIHFTVLVEGPAEKAHVPEEFVKTERDRFYARFPFLNTEVTGKSPELSRVVNYVYPWRKSDAGTSIVEFAAIPASEAKLRAEDFCLYRSVNRGELVHLYLCLDDGVRSAALADRLAEALEYHDSECLATLYRYYNYPEREVEHDTGEKRSEGRPVIPFGSVMAEDAEAAVTRSFVERAAMHIHYSFQGVDPKKVETPADRHCFIERLWNEATEWERESNRQAAAHFLVKLHCLGVCAELRWDPGSWNEVLAVDDDSQYLFDLKETLIREKKEVEAEKKNAGSERKPPPNSASADRAASDHTTDKPAATSDAAILADMEHRRWCMERLLNGWLPLPDGELREQWENDKDRRQLLKKRRHWHRDLIPFDDLSPDERGKDYDQLIAMLEFLEEQ